MNWGVLTRLYVVLIAFITSIFTAIHYIREFTDESIMFWIFYVVGYSWIFGTCVENINSLLTELTEENEDE